MRGIAWLSIPNSGQPPRSPRPIGSSAGRIRSRAGHCQKTRCRRAGQCAVAARSFGQFVENGAVGRSGLSVVARVCQAGSDGGRRNLAADGYGGCGESEAVGGGCATSPARSVETAPPRSPRQEPAHPRRPRCSRCLFCPHADHRPTHGANRLTTAPDTCWPGAICRRLWRRLVRAHPVCRAGCCWGYRARCMPPGRWISGSGSGCFWAPWPIGLPLPRACANRPNAWAMR